MHRLLIDSERAGYPGEYLVARIRARKQDCRSGESRERLEEGADDFSLPRQGSEERRWLYLQMEVRLRKLLAPLLFVFELEMVIHCLRIRGEGDSETKLAEQLQASLLNRTLREIMLAGATLSDTVAGLEAFLQKSVFAVGGLHQAYQAKGVQGAEEHLRRRFLAAAPGLSRHPVVERFFRRLIDRRNIMTLAKCLRWQPEQIPPLLRGGYLRRRAVDRTVDPLWLQKLVSRFTGGDVPAEEDLHPVRLQRFLAKHEGRDAFRMMRETGPVHCCTGYLWYCSLTARKSSREKAAATFAERFPAEEESSQ